MNGCEQKIFFDMIQESISQMGYTPPNIYVDMYVGEPTIFSADGTPLQSCAGDSPVGVLREYVKVLDRLNY